MDEAEARRRFSAGRVARMVSVDAGGQPHVVPVVFAVDGDWIYSIVDAKPKRNAPGPPGYSRASSIVVVDAVTGEVLAADVMVYNK